MKNIDIRLASEADLPALIEAGDNLFDYEVKPERAREFFADKRHHLAIACYGDKIVGMASALDYVHPDKDPHLFINEASVIEEFQGQGIGRALIKFIVAYGSDIGCREAWVATEKTNLAARKAYVAAGGREDKEDIVLIEFRT